MTRTSKPGSYRCVWCVSVTHRDAASRPAVRADTQRGLARGCLQTRQTTQPSSPASRAGSGGRVFSELRQLQGILLEDDIIQAVPDGAFNTLAPPQTAFINYTDTMARLTCPFLTLKNTVSLITLVGSPY